VSPSFNQQHYKIDRKSLSPCGRGCPLGRERGNRKGYSHLRLISLNEICFILFPLTCPSDILSHKGRGIAGLNVDKN